MAAAPERLNTPRTRPKIRGSNGLPRAAGRMPTNRVASVPVLDRTFETGGLAELRAEVTAYAGELGVTGSKLEDVMLLAHELCGNAIAHGGGAGRLQVWRDDHHLLCRVSDAGPGMIDIDAGATLPSPRSPGGRGLWLARRIAVLHIESTPDGTTVIAEIPLP